MAYAEWEIDWICCRKNNFESIIYVEFIIHAYNIRVRRGTFLIQDFLSAKAIKIMFRTWTSGISDDHIENKSNYAKNTEKKQQF